MTTPPPRQRRITITLHEKQLPVEALEALLVARGLRLDQAYAIVPDMMGEDVYVQTVLDDEEPDAAMPDAKEGT